MLDHLVRLITLAAVAPALTGAGSAPTAQALAECRATHDEAFEALKAYPVANNREIASGHATYFVVPQGVTAFGAPLTDFSRLDKQGDGHEVLSIMSVVAAPYEQVKAAALKSRGATDCSVADEGRTCMIEVRSEGPWVIALAVLRYGDKSGLACRYARET